MKRSKSVNTFISVVLLFVLSGACHTLTEKEIVFRQSYESGKAVYENQCRNCHKANGEGLGALYPPIQNSDYLAANIKKLPCIIYNGMNEKIVVNGKQYHWEMPSHKTMDEIEMSALLTYIQAKWLDTKEAVGYKDARMAIEDCKK